MQVAKNPLISKGPAGRVDKNGREWCSKAYQCTKARLAYMRSNLWSRREKTSAMAVELEIMHTARCTLARSPPVLKPNPSLYLEKFHVPAS